MNSYEKINYTLRPQKRIERALFAELINEFNYLIKDAANYIGMGSLYFADYVYFHKMTKLNKMISFELLNEKTNKENELKKTRFINNKPLDEIELIFKEIGKAIEDGDIPFDEHNFVWLDYDNPFVPAYLEDITNAINKENKTSLFALTFSNWIPDKYKSSNTFNTEQCYNDFESYIPYSIEKKDFNKNSYNTIVKLTCDEYLKSILNDKNNLYGTDFNIKRISTITYKDGVEMTTMLWLLYDNKFDIKYFHNKLNEIGICEELNLYMSPLSLYEKMYLDKHSSDNREHLSECTGIDKDTIDKYYLYSKYIPEYSEILL